MTEQLVRHIRLVPDFPKEGILFRDITPLLGNGVAFRGMIDTFAARYRSDTPDRIVAVESRGLILGAALAYELAIGLVPVRKAGKLPYETYSAAYSLEYGKDGLEIHRDAVKPGEKILIVDDLLATGGTLKAAIELVEKCGAGVQEIACLIELVELKGREHIGPYPVETLLKV